MSQQPDLTIPFDASVVDEEALRALRAVQRAHPFGDGVTGGNLVGGTEAVAAFGMVPGAPLNGAAIKPFEVAAGTTDLAGSQAETPLKALDIEHPENVSSAVDASQAETLAVSATPLSSAAPRVAVSHTGSGYVPSKPDASSSLELVSPDADFPDKGFVVRPPVREEPKPEELADIRADTPLVNVNDASGREDQPIALDLSATLADIDGSELLSLSIFGVPEGASLSHGTRQRDGSWSVSSADLPNLALIPPENFSGTFNLTFRATSQETNGDSAAIEATFTVQVHAVADAPFVTVADAHGQEDAVVSLAGLGGALRDTDGSESLSFVLSGVPAGATLSAGTALGGGRWALTPAQLNGLSLSPPAQFSCSFKLTLTAIATESEAGVMSARTSATFTVSLDPAVDTGAINGASTGAEDTAILLQPEFSTPDADGSESWSEFTQVSGLPAGARLNLGTEIAPGTWQVPTADLRAGLVSIHPAEHSDADFTLTLTATLTDTGNGTSVSRTVTGTHTVTVEAVADAPLVSASNVSGDEDQPIALKLSSDLVDQDGSETLSVSILGVPDGASLSHGSRAADGSWSVSPADLPHLSLTPPKDFSGTIKLTLQATSRESANGATATRSAAFQVEVDNVSDAPLVSTHNAEGLEDQSIALVLAAALTDTDGSEDLSISILGVPDGASLSKGDRQPDGSWRVDPADLEQLSILPPPNFSGEINLTLQATAVSTNGATAVTSAPFRVHVEAIADAPIVSVRDAETNEDQAVALDLSVALTDTDLSEVLSVVIGDFPPGTRLSAGTDNGDGSWTLTRSELSGLTMTPPTDWSGTMALTLSAHARETSNGDTATTSATFEVKVEAVADAPLVIAHNVSGLEDTPIPLDLSAALKDQDGSELLSIRILGVPADVSLSHGTRETDGSWRLSPSDLPNLKLTPRQDFSGPLDLRIEATATEGNGKTATIEVGFRVQVGAVADVPDVTVINFSGQEDTPVDLTGLGGALKDLDGSETLSFLLSVPSGAMLSAGIPQSNGKWLLTPDQLKGLILTPPPHGSGTYTLKLTAIATESQAGVPSAQTSATFTVKFDPVLDTGTISGSTSGWEDTPITLNPVFATPDQDGSETWSEFTKISGVPSGAKLNLGTETSTGVWEVKTADLRAGRVTITPPEHSDNDLTLTFTATLTDAANGKTVSGIVTGTYAVTVNAVADAPNVSAENVSGNEDQYIALDLSASLVDRDGTESLTVKIFGVPGEAKLSYGVLQSDGSWLVNEEDLPHLSIKPPEDFSGTLKLTIQATATESSNKNAASKEVSFEVQVDAVADTPGLRVSPSVGDEDSAIPIHVSAWTADRDGSESIVAFRITGVPPGAVVKAGGVVLECSADGTVLVDPTVVNSLTITPPAHSDKDFTLQVIAISEEPNGSTAKSDPLDVSVKVRAVADAPVLDVTSASGSEDSLIPLNLTATLPDADGSEKLSFVITGVPDDAILSHGTYRGRGTWSLTAEEAAQVTLRPRADFSGTIDLTVTAISQEQDGGDQATTRVEFPVTVGAVVDAPSVGGLDGTSGNWGTMNGTEDRPIALHFNPGLTDSDASEKVVGDILVSGVPAGAVLRLADGTEVVADENGIYTIAAADMAGVTLTMPRDSDKRETLTVRMTIEDSGGVRATIGGHMVVDPAGDADTPVLTLDPSSGKGHDSADAGQGWIPLHITAASGDIDDSETLYMWVRDVPEGAMLSAGLPVGNHLWLVPVESLPSLSIRPPAGYYGKSFDLSVTAVAVEREGDQSVRTEAVRVTVTVPDGGGGTGGDGSGTTPGNPGSAPVAQKPTLVVTDAETTEDNGIRLSIKAATDDTDNGHETLGIRIDGVPEGARLSVGVRDPLTGAWVLRQDQLDQVSFIPPADFSGTITLSVTAVSTEATGHQAINAASLDIKVDAVADAAVIEATPPAGIEDQAIALNLKVEAGDRDGSEHVTTVVISGIPGGARLEGDGITDLGDGRWSVDPLQLASLRFVPPPDQYGTYVLTVTATAEEASNGHTRDTSRTISISVAPDADVPVVIVRDAAGYEDKTIDLDLSAALTDIDGSEVLSIVIEGLPEGALLSAGINNGDGSWTLTRSQLSGLTLTPPAEWSGTMALTLLAHARETSNGSVETTRTTFNVQISAVADTPVVSARDAAGLEDQPIALNLTAILTDRDGSELLSVSISGIPAGASLSHGTKQPDGSWDVSPADLQHLTITAPQHFSGSFSLTLRATTREENGETASSTATFKVQVAAVADAPDVTVVDFAGHEDTPLRLSGLGGALVDTDGSESLSFVLSGVPTGASLSAGTQRADGTWLLTPAELANLTLTPPSQASGAYTLTLTGIATEDTGGPSAHTAVDFTVSFDPVVDTGTISGSRTGAEDTQILIQPTFTLQDNDGSETWSEFTLISGVPTGASLNLGTEVTPGTWQVATIDLQAGRVKFQPAEHSDADVALTLTATLTDTGNGTSVSREVSGTYNVNVTAVADAPLVHAGDASGQEDRSILLDLSANLVDTDGSETLSVRILGVPEGFTLSHGTSLGGGVWRVPAESLSGLQLTPAPNWNGTVHLTLQATSTEATGQAATTTTPFTVTIDAVNDAPTLALTASDQHAKAGAEQAHTIDLAQVHDVDSSYLGGATIVLSGAQDGDKLDFDRLDLREEDGRMMIGDTGIEVVGEGYASETGVLTLRGSATPATYAAVLESLVLESEDGAGLAAGTRSIGVTLFDSADEKSAMKSVEVVVDEVTPPPSESQNIAFGADSGTMQDLAGADMLLLMADAGGDPSNGIAGSWTEQIDAGDAAATPLHPIADLDQPVSDHAQPMDEFHLEAARVNWS